MDNHYHLLIETPEGNLSAGMRHLNGVYTQAYNRIEGKTDISRPDPNVNDPNVNVAHDPNMHCRHRCGTWADCGDAGCQGY